MTATAVRSRLHAVADTDRGRALDRIALEYAPNVKYWRPGRFIVFRHLPTAGPDLTVAWLPPMPSLSSPAPRFAEKFCFSYFRISRYRRAIFVDEQVAMERLDLNRSRRWGCAS